MGPRQHAVGMGDDDSDGGEQVGGQQDERDITQSGGLQILEFPRSRHSHLEEEEAEDPLEQVNEELVVILRDLDSLEAADETNGDPAEQQVESRIQEDLMEELLA